MSKRLLLYIVVFPALVLALAVGACASAGAVPTSASAALGGTATLVAKGAAIDVPVIYSCSSDTSAGTIVVIVSERVPGNHTASGVADTFGNEFGMICDGTQHTADIRVTSNNTFAFHKGTGVVRGSFEACDIDGSCASPLFSGLIKIAKK